MTTPLRWKAPKDPDEIKDYWIEWSDLLGDDTIRNDGTGSTWIVPDGVTKQSDSVTTTRATIWLTGGVAGKTYKLTNRVKTDGGRTYDRSVILRVNDL